MGDKYDRETARANNKANEEKIRKGAEEKLATERMIGQQENPSKYIPSGKEEPLEHLTGEEEKRFENARKEQLEEQGPYTEMFKNIVLSGINNGTDLSYLIDGAMRYPETLSKYLRDFCGHVRQNLSELLKGGLTVEQIDSRYNNVSGMLNDFAKIMYTLKDKGYDFRKMDLGADSIEYNFTSIGGLNEIFNKVENKYYNKDRFKMNVPYDFGNSYGEDIQTREGDARAVLSMMFDDLKGKEVNWEWFNRRNKHSKNEYADTSRTVPASKVNRCYTKNKTRN